jgi:hypothetical protein
MAGERHGRGMLCVNPHLAARHGRGTAWARHAMCESALKDLGNLSREGYMSSMQ